MNHKDHYLGPSLIPVSRGMIFSFLNDPLQRFCNCCLRDIEGYNLNSSNSWNYYHKNVAIWGILLMVI